MNNLLISEKIRKYRAEKRITQGEFGALVGVSAQAVSKWEREACCPDITLLPKLSEIIGCGLEELFTDGKI